jgi:hypothetical protein
VAEVVLLPHASAVLDADVNPPHICRLGVIRFVGLLWLSANGILLEVKVNLEHSGQDDTLKIAVFWVVAPRSLVEVYQRFRGPSCLHHQGDEP